MNDETIYPKSSFLMCLTRLKRLNPETDEEPQYSVIDSKFSKCSGREFKESFFEERKKGNDVHIEIVYAKPEKFIINQLYMLATRDRMWVWVEG